MNTKRQALWLVSILGIMVVLSAYYLLTDEQRIRNVSKEDSAKIAQIQQEVDESLTETDMKVSLRPVEIADSHEKPTHETSISTQDYFIAMQMKRHEALRKKTEHLMSTIADQDQKPEIVAQATQELETLSNLEEKMGYLEEELLREFPQVVIMNDGDDWRVTIQAQKLEKSQSVSIIDKMMQELHVRPEHIKLQLVRP